MSLLLVGVALLMLWLIGGKKARGLSFRDGAAIGAAIVGAVLTVKGKPLIGGAAMAGAAAWLMLSVRQGRPKAEAPRRDVKWVEARDVAEAREILGVGADADAEDIRAAHRRLIALTHPDKGGTPALAARINDARDLLLRQLERM